jgi:hypothetical protein
MAQADKVLLVAVAALNINVIHSLMAACALKAGVAV